MSTILDALRKLQRERAAESPSRDLRGSLTSETPRGRVRRRGASSRWVVLALLLVSIAGGGYWLYGSGQLGALRAQFAGSAGDAMEVAEAEDRPVSEEEFAALEREIAAREAAATPEPETAPAPQVAAPPVAPVAPVPPAPRVDTPETLAERARLEAALANARAAQEAQRKAEAEAAAAAAAAAPSPPAPPVADVPAAKPPAAVKPPEKKVEVAAQAPVAKPTTAAKPTPPAANAAAASPAPAPARPAPARRAEPAPAARVETETPSMQSAFPTVRVESIRWHPIPERRVANLQFERQNVPQAREGDIVAGVLVYRIDPGAVELRIGTAHRVVSPEP